MGTIADQIANFAEAPHSTVEAKIDDKGRLKLPSGSLDWCKKSNILNVFITTFDKQTVRIYPIPVWKSTLSLLEAPGPNAKIGADLARVAKKYGGDAEIDAQGRLLLPSALRTLLSLEGETMAVEHASGRIDLTVKAVYDKVMEDAEANLASKFETFRELGL
jgi:MraZ protein